MSVKLLTEHHLKFLSLKGGCRARQSLHLSKCQIVVHLMPRLIWFGLMLNVPVNSYGHVGTVQSQVISK